jgi:hypothetical protein
VTDYAPELDIGIVVPSRRRPHNMPRIRELLPTAMVCIDERELAAYAPFVPSDQLLLHPPMDGFAVVCNWIMDNVANEILVFVDDDFHHVSVMTGWRRSGRGGRITDPADILQIIENAARAAHDVGSSTFCFSRTNNSTLFDIGMKPATVKPILSNVFGIMGPARRRKMDPRFAGRNAIDLSIRTLLEDRFGYMDSRFYFDCGMIFGGQGGNVGLITTDKWVATTRLLKETWGAHVSLKRTALDTRGKIDTMSIKVDRSNPRAQK